MSKAPKLTRAERRERRDDTPANGVYGVDAQDAGADSWTGRYLMWAASPDEARERIRDAGFHKKQIEKSWTPSHRPPEGLPLELGEGTSDWFRSRWDTSGWTNWERLPSDYRHPPQGLAAVDPSVR